MGFAQTLMRLSDTLGKWKAYVIKNNKLMGGKGIAVCEDHEETLFMLEYFRDVMESLILQEKIDGVEISAGVSVCGFSGTRWLDDDFRA